MERTVGYNQLPLSTIQDPETRRSLEHFYYPLAEDEQEYRNLLHAESDIGVFPRDPALGETAYAGMWGAFVAKLYNDYWDALEKLEGLLDHLASEGIELTPVERRRYHDAITEEYLDAIEWVNDQRFQHILNSPALPDLQSTTIDEPPPRLTSNLNFLRDRRVPSGYLEAAIPNNQGRLRTREGCLGRSCR